MGTRMVRQRTNRKSGGKLSAGSRARMRDERIHGLQKALAACAAAGNRRDNLIAGRYAWPKYFVALLDELVFHRVPTVEILGIETALRDAVRRTVFVGTSAPKDALGEALARESLAEGIANSESNKLLDDPDCTVRLRQLDQALAIHEAEIARARMVIARDLAILNSAETVTAGVS